MTSIQEVGSRGIFTIDDLLWAKQHDPALVEECFKQVTIMEDLERYLQWLHDTESQITVVSKLNRWQSRALGIHPSSACKDAACLLKLYYECTGKIPPSRTYNPDDQRTWDIGTLLHDLYQAHFRSMYGDRFEDEVHLENDELHIKSHADGIFSFTMIRAVLEMKSIKEGGNFGWEKIQASPMEDNVRQSYFYMRLKNVPFAIIFYMCKNNGKLKEHPVMFDPAVWQNIVDKTVQPVIAAAYDGGKMVEGKPGWHCKQCSYQYRCPAAQQERTHVKGSTRKWSGG